MNLSLGRIALLVGVACVPILYLVGSCYKEFGSKAEYSVLQLVEERERNSSIPDVTFRVVNGYTVAGFPADGHKGNVWILLHPKHSPYYKQVPQLQFTISRNVMDRVRHTEDVSDTVIAVLETRMTK
jgi:hypothetical protein